MRVLYLTHSYPRWLGDAAGSFLLHLAAAQREAGLDVRVLAPSSASLAREDVLLNVPVQRFRYAPRGLETLAYTGNMASDVRGSWSAKAALAGYLAAQTVACARIKRSWKPHIVHAHWWFPSGLGAVSAWGGAVPVVTTMHGSDVRLARTSPAGRRLLRYVLGRSRASTTVSRWLADQVTAMAPDRSPAVEPMPVATELFSAPPLGERRANSLLFVGRLNQQKGIADLVRALPYLPTATTLTVVGDGPDRPQLLGLCESLGVSHRVTWLGALKQTELPVHYQQAAVVVIPSIDEGLGLVAVEAQLCETPVVAYRSGGMPDVVFHQETGLLSQPGDVAALAVSITELLGDPARAQTFGRAGRARALERFSAAAVAKRYIALYERAISV